MAQVYIKDIVFGATIDARAIKFFKEMKKEFEMSGRRAYIFLEPSSETKEGRHIHLTRKIC